MRFDCSGACVAAPGASPVLVAALEHFADARVDARADAANGRCERLVIVSRGRTAARAPAGWELMAQVRRPTERNETTAIYRRSQ